MPDDTCPHCGHEWRRHDPEDGRCDAHSAERGVFGPCRCGRDVAFTAVANARLSRLSSLLPLYRWPGGVMADDERQAEIEAVAQALSQAAEFESFVGTVGAWRAAARVAIAALDRVRDARGDDEALRAAAQAVLNTRFSSSFAEMNRALDGLDSALRISVGHAVRSPQGEDHEDTGNYDESGGDPF